MKSACDCAAPTCLLLKGDGACNFSPVWPNQSGLIVPGDATCVATADFDKDGKFELLIGVNDEAPMLFMRE